MKKTIILIAFSLAASLCFAQEIPQKEIEDSFIGWAKVYNLKGAKQPLTVDQRNFSIAQLSCIDSFVNWMQASYIPKGGLGDMKKIVSPKLNAYNQHTAGLPQHYGANAVVYMFLKRNADGKLVPANSLCDTWSMIANGVPEEWILRDMSTASQCYFTLPSYESAHDSEWQRQFHDLSREPNIAPYINFWVQSIETGGGSNYVLLSKDNRSPFVKLTKGDYLRIVEASLPTMQELEKKKLYEAEQGNEKRMAPWLKIMDEKYEKRRQFLKQVKEKYRNRLGELALVSPQPSMTDLENGRDIFSNGYLADAESTSGRVPVYTIDPAMAEQCKKDKPQWILMGWWWHPKDPRQKFMHESIINNFNFAYVYNFFFDPEKVKGIAYKPLRSPSATEAAVVTEASSAAKKNRADKNIYFFDDFSTTQIGKKPVGWKTRLGIDGNTSTVTTLEGLKGNWVTGNYELTPQGLNAPFPQDFTLSYDVVAAENFTWGSKALTLELSGAGSYLRLSLRPGFDGRDGETTIEGKFPEGYFNTTKWVKAPGFSNNKKNNLINVSIKKKGERLQVLIDDKVMADYEKAIPAGMVFKGLEFLDNGNTGSNDKYYIGNIKIVKD